MEGYISEIRYFGGNFAPLYWMYCQGQLLSIAENTALFSLIGTIYGGDGQVTFALPNMAGRMAVGTGQGPGLPNVELGEVAGAENVSMTTLTMPSHNHQVMGNVTYKVGTTGTASSPTGNITAETGSEEFISSANGTMKANPVSATTGATGSGQPFNVMQPYITLACIICTEGIYPSRN